MADAQWWEPAHKGAHRSVGGAHTDGTPRHQPQIALNQLFWDFCPAAPPCDRGPAAHPPDDFHLLGFFGCSVRNNPFTTIHSARGKARQEGTYQPLPGDMGCTSATFKKEGAVRRNQFEFLGAPGPWAAPLFITIIGRNLPHTCPNSVSQAAAPATASQIQTLQ